jgi:Tfp pilus assembly protein PilN
VSPAFTVNFRREAYRLERARARRRMMAMGIWVTYFGVLAVVLGLYGLNCASLSQRVRLLEAQNLRMQTRHDPATAWRPGPADLAQVEQTLANARRWHVRLARLATVLPGDAMLTSVTANPDNQASAADQERLLIVGMLRPTPGPDRMQGIMALVAALHADSLFSAQYRTIRLVESRIGGGADAPVEFRIECR